MIAEHPTTKPAGIPAWAPLSAAAGLAALALREPGLGAVAVVVAVGAAGVLLPVASRDRVAPPGEVLAALTIGVLAVSLAARAATLPSLPFAALPVAASVLAGVAEEAFFRRFLYGWLAARGVAVAIAVPAAAFALVHLPLYGVDGVGLNLAAGLLFGWQRWATGTWTAPAATHALANVLAYL